MSRPSAIACEMPAVRAGSSMQRWMVEVWIRTSTAGSSPEPSARSMRRWETMPLSTCESCPRICRSWAPGLHRKLRDDRRQVELLEVRQLVGDGAEGDRHAPPRPADAGPEPPDPGHAVLHVHPALALVALTLAGGHHRDRHGVEVLRL